MHLRARATVVLVLLGLLHLPILFAGFVAPYDPAEQDREQPYVPPTGLHFVDATGLHLRPFVYASTPTLDGSRQDARHQYAIRFFVQGSRYSFLGMGRTNLHLFGVEQPAMIRLLGTDGYGRDEFSRLLYGGVSLSPPGLRPPLLRCSQGL